MNQLVLLVEGPGDVLATPFLLKKLLYGAGYYDWHVPTPLAVGELPKLRKVLDRRIEELRVKMMTGRCHGVLILLDLDDSTACPVAEARALAAELAGHQLPYPVAVVFARREYEEWLVASLPSIAPATPLLPNELRRDYPPESIRNPKGWLKGHTRNQYVETVHQAEFTRHLDPALAAECRSFQRLQHALAELLHHAALPDTVRRGVTTPTKA
jgi:Domain of unknown function (DUF4276)